MKQYLSIALSLVCVALVVVFIFIKQGDDVRHGTDIGTIAGFSNRLDLAQTQIALCNGKMITLSNRLVECRSASFTRSNQLADTQSTVLLQSGQITNLTRQVAGMSSENQSLVRRVMELTNQVAGLTGQIAASEAGLAEAGRNYGLLENRLRRDVAERIVVERKFNNPSELQAQLQNLKTNPARVISTESILAGLDIEVNSNGTYYVISPN
jgi:hypothetical protein